MTLIRRISPVGGGGGSGVVILRSMPIPLFHRTQPSTIAKPTQMMVEAAGTNVTLQVSVHPKRSMMVALAMPPPSHIVCSP